MPWFCKVSLMDTWRKLKKLNERTKQCVKKYEFKLEIFWCILKKEAITYVVVVCYAPGKIRSIEETVKGIFKIEKVKENSEKFWWKF